MLRAWAAWLITCKTNPMKRSTKSSQARDFFWMQRSSRFRSISESATGCFPFEYDSNTVGLPEASGGAGEKAAAPAADGWVNRGGTGVPPVVGGGVSSGTGVPPVVGGGVSSGTGVPPVVGG